MTLPLAGKVALVTGGGVRLGRAIAEGLGHAGADVAVHCHASKDGARACVEALRVDGNRAEVFEADLSRPEAPATLAAAVEQAFGRVDLLVNSASVLVQGPFAATTPEVLERLWAVNVRAPFLLTQALAAGMKARGQGDVVNVLDLAGTSQTWRDAAAYQGTRGALAAMTRALAVELAPEIRVNGVAPGLVLPPDAMPAEARAALTARIPQRRPPDPAEVVATIVFLLGGPRAVTGQILPVDGGRHLASF